MLKYTRSLREYFGKQKCKKMLQQRNCISVHEIPVVGVINRADQAACRFLVGGGLFCFTFNKSTFSISGFVYIF